MRVHSRRPNFAAIRMLMSPDENPGAPAPDGAAPKPDEKTPPEGAKPSSTMIGDVPAPGPDDEPKPDAKDGGDPPQDQKDGKAPAVPEKYELSLPENSPLDAQATERISAFARETGLSQEQAAKVVGFLNTEVTSRDATFLESNRPGGAEWTAKVQQFEGLALADKDIGGSRDVLEANVAKATKVITKYFEPGFLAVLKETGFGAHPMIIKGFAKMADAVSEGSAPPRDPSVPSGPTKTRAQKLYPNLPSESSGATK